MCLFAHNAGYRLFLQPSGRKYALTRRRHRRLIFPRMRVLSPARRELLGCSVVIDPPEDRHREVCWTGQLRPDEPTDSAIHSAARLETSQEVPYGKHATGDKIQAPLQRGQRFLEKEPPHTIESYAKREKSRTEYPA